VDAGIGPARSARSPPASSWADASSVRDEGACSSRARDVYAATSDLRGARKEHFVTFHLNARNQVIARETVSIGSLNASIVHPREVYEAGRPQFGRLDHPRPQPPERRDRPVGRRPGADPPARPGG
jgi:hypothetical protein